MYSLFGAEVHAIVGFFLQIYQMYYGRDASSNTHTRYTFCMFNTYLLPFLWVLGTSSAGISPIIYQICGIISITYPPCVHNTNHKPICNKVPFTNQSADIIMHPVCTLHVCGYNACIWYITWIPPPGNGPRTYWAKRTGGQLRGTILTRLVDVVKNCEGLYIEGPT